MSPDPIKPWQELMPEIAVVLLGLATIGLAVYIYFGFQEKPAGFLFVIGAGTILFAGRAIYRGRTGR